jgi:hypothetical protein
MDRPALSIALDDDALNALADELAERVAVRVAARLSEQSTTAGYLRPDAAAHYMGVARKRLYDLKSAGAIEPDGYDGRTPLFTRSTLDAYVRSGGS